MSLHSNLFKAGQIWDWHHNGVNSAPTTQLEFLEDNSLSMGLKEINGSWKFLDSNTILIKIIHIDHVLIFDNMLNFDGNDWVLVFPVRNPPSMMRSESVKIPITKM
jgi:hypothetical protein